MSDTEAGDDPSRGRLVVGSLIVLVGVVLLVDTPGAVAIDLGDLLVSGGLLVLGLLLVVERVFDGRYDRLFGPTVLALVGALLLADDLAPGVDAFQYFLPLVLIILGVAYLTRDYRRRLASR